MSHNPTITEADATTIDSGRPPDDMHQISIADAITQHRLTLVVFASPAFCTSRTCGPEVKAVQSLEPAYRDKLTFIHIEIYRDFVPDPSKRKLAQTVLDWRLQTEPWIFLVDAKGIIQTRFEGATATDELKSALDQLLREDYISVPGRTRVVSSWGRQRWYVRGAMADIMFDLVCQHGGR